jgi:anti-anti-sigma factor
MSEPKSRLLVVERHGDAVCVRLQRMQLDEHELYEVGEELLQVIRGGSPRVALTLGPEPPQFLFSVFLAKLITAQRVAHENGGELKLCNCSQEVLDIFDVCKLDTLFEFVPDAATALTDWGAPLEPTRA